MILFALRCAADHEFEGWFRDGAMFDRQSAAGKITQYFDRDSRPDFAGANGMQSFLKQFIANPQADPTKLQATMQQFWDSLPAEK